MTVLPAHWRRSGFPALPRPRCARCERRMRVFPGDPVGTPGNGDATDPVVTVLVECPTPHCGGTGTGA
ncbi:MULTISPECIES: hypothetical protein [unclassified Streptomyces]|uniref:hypothetical protein n=1 Tax=unclassified Streptomyces TaxID=2593676 RepID=UPI002238B653|nr:hypothetical protein [Streptomyces sp. SHP 1-2]MCW5251214.1 hypothetical protein [Streptomyces sp. SHP 1-2]